MSKKREYSHGITIEALPASDKRHVVHKRYIFDFTVIIIKEKSLCLHINLNLNTKVICLSMRDSGIRSELKLSESKKYFELAADPPQPGEFEEGILTSENRHQYDGQDSAASFSSRTLKVHINQPSPHRRVFWCKAKLST